MIFHHSFENMQYELTGGGIVLTADTATFELI
jgi:hypothetical protein